MPEEYSFKSIPWYALILGLGIVIASVITSVLSDFRATQSDTQTSVRNDTLTWGGNNTAMALSQSNLVVGSQKVYINATGPIGSGNYTMNNVGGTITFLNQTTYFNGSNMTSNLNLIVTNNINVSYDYTYGSAEKNLTRKGQEAEIKFANWFTTIGLVLGAIIVIGVIMQFFPGISDGFRSRK